MINITANMSWQDIANAAQTHLADTVSCVEPRIPDPPADLPLNVTSLPAKLLSTDVVRITESSTEDLLHKLATGRLTSKQVVNAFLQRAGLASKLVNCITELIPQKALERAAELDRYYARHGKPIGPLHGLPISVKEHIAMKGQDLNAGFVSWVGNVAPDDGLILKLLWNAGCVFYARTTEPQTLMHLETSSNIYGVTVNPYNTKLTSGGSSGGEGALLGIRGSCLGIGTDIGGSIRSPAANQGLFGLRPSSYRLPLEGFAATMLGAEHIVPVVGPLSTSLEGVKIFMKALIDQKPWLYEPMLVPMPWKNSVTEGTLVSHSLYTICQPKYCPDNCFGYLMAIDQRRKLARTVFQYYITKLTSPAPHKLQHPLPPHRHPPRRRHRQTAPAHSPRHEHPPRQTPIQPQHHHSRLPTLRPRRSLAHHQQPVLRRRRLGRAGSHGRVFGAPETFERVHPEGEQECQDAFCP